MFNWLQKKIIHFEPTTDQTPEQVKFTTRERQILTFPSGSGYAYECTGSNWRTAVNDDWDIQVYDPDGGEVFMGYRTIDDTRCAVFGCSDGVFRAVTKVACK